MSEANQREEAIFETALKLPADQRNAFLTEACTGDDALRERIAALLGAFDRATGFMSEPATPVRSTSDTPVSEKPGDWIGRYKLLEQIGEGGCGVVYVAEQEQPVRRRVALKIIKLGMDTKQVIARFDAERQALAMMDHPNIAKVFDAGSTDGTITHPHPASGHPLPSDGRGAGGEGRLSAGRPYFVMELVRGVKITDYCEQNHLTPRERLDLFIQVCRAIQHAHQKGIIHRDIKPSNVLVASADGVPVPKVIDFGIAKATQGRLTDHTVYTAFEQFIGTPAYMSPEQAALTLQDIDTRSDIYSLGVLLYELLTGTTPFDAKELLSKGLDEMRRTIREVEPVKPSTRLTQQLERTNARKLPRPARNERGEGGGRGAIDKTSDGEKSTSSPLPSPPLRRGEGDATLRPSHFPIPSDLDWIVMKCLEKDRTRRYETANGLSTDIQRHLNNEPIVARPPSQLYRFQKTVQRNKLAVGAAITVVLALAIGFAVSTSMYFKVQAEKKNAQTQAIRSEQVAQIMTEMLEGARPSVAMGKDPTVLRDILERTAARIEKELTDQPEVQGDLLFTLAKTYSDISDQTNAVVLYAHVVKCYRQCYPRGHTKLALSLSYLGAAQSFCHNVREGSSNAALGLSMARQLKDEKTLGMCLAWYGYSLKEAGAGCPEAVPYLQEALAISWKFGTNKAYIWMLSRLSISMTDNEKRLPLTREVLAAETALAGGASPVVAYRHWAVAQNLLDLRRPVEAEPELRHALKLWRQYYISDHPHRDPVFRDLIDALVKQGKWQEAEVELQNEDRLTSATNQHVPLHAAIEIARGNWEQAIKVLTPIVPNLSGGTNDLSATALALKGDAAIYHEHSRRILEQTPVGPDYMKMEWTARATLLLPPTSDNLQRAGELADAISRVDNDLRFAPWASMTKSLAEYRRGNFEGAVEWSLRCLAADNVQEACRATSEFVYAMACSRLGNSDEAQKAFGGGTRRIKRFQLGTRRDNGVVFSYSQLKEFWHLQDWVSVEVLRREAAALLQATDPKQGVRQ